MDFYRICKWAPLTSDFHLGLAKETPRMGGVRVWAMTNSKIIKCIDDLFVVLFVPRIYPTRDLHSKQFDLKSFENKFCMCARL